MQSRDKDFLVRGPQEAWGGNEEVKEGKREAGTWCEVATTVDNWCSLQLGSLAHTPCGWKEHLEHEFPGCWA